VFDQPHSHWAWRGESFHAPSGADRDGICSAYRTCAGAGHSRNRRWREGLDRSDGAWLSDAGGCDRGSRRGNPALRGEKVTFAGRVFRTDRIGLSFKSSQAEIPIYLGVLGARNLAMAGRIADGVMLSALTSPAYAWFAAEKIHAAAQTAGRGGKLELGAFLLTSISEDERAARAAIKPLLAAMISLMAAQPPTPLFTAAGMDPEELRRFAETYARGELPVRLVTDSIIDTFAIAGGPDRCGAALQKILDAGVTQPVFFETPGIPAEKTIRAIHKYLMPRFL
jgi:5,10-methylenetetrahydromethanopterin reductase